MNRLFRYFAEHKNAFQVLRIALVLAVVIIAAVASVGAEAGPFGDGP